MFNAPQPTGLAALYAAMAPVRVAAAPMVDLDQLVADARIAGMAEGARLAEARLEPQQALLAAASAAFNHAAIVDSAMLAPVFAALVTAMAETVVMAELALNPAVIGRLVDVALAAIETAPSAVIRLHPDDAAMLDREDLAVVVDASQRRGSVVVDGPTFVVRHDLTERLAAVLEESA